MSWWVILEFSFLYSMSLELKLCFSTRNNIISIKIKQKGHGRDIRLTFLLLYNVTWQYGRGVSNSSYTCPHLCLESRSTADWYILQLSLFSQVFQAPLKTHKGLKHLNSSVSHLLAHPLFVKWLSPWDLSWIFQFFLSWYLLPCKVWLHSSHSLFVLGLSLLVSFKSSLPLIRTLSFKLLTVPL